MTIHIGAANAAKTINLTSVSGFPPFIIFVKVFEDVVVPSVEKRLAEAGGKYKIRWTRAYGALIAKEENTLEAVADGLVDIGFVSFIFEQTKQPLPVMTYIAPFGSYDPRVLGEVQDEMYRDIPELNEGWHKQNQIYLAGTMINSFQIFSRQPIRGVDDLKGMKFGLAGPLASWLKGTGAISVHNPVTEGYQALKSGMIDAQLIFPTGAFAFKFYEPAPYVVKANLGAASGGDHQLQQEALGGPAARGARGLSRGGRGPRQGLPRRADRARQPHLRCHGQGRGQGLDNGRSRAGQMGHADAQHRPAMGRFA